MPINYTSTSWCSRCFQPWSGLSPICNQCKIIEQQKLQLGQQQDQQRQQEYEATLQRGYARFNERGTTSRYSWPDVPAVPKTQEELDQLRELYIKQEIGDWAKIIFVLLLWGFMPWAFFHYIVGI